MSRRFCGVEFPVPVQVVGGDQLSIINKIRFATPNMPIPLSVYYYKIKIFSDKPEIYSIIGCALNEKKLPLLKGIF